MTGLKFSQKSLSKNNQYCLRKCQLYVLVTDQLCLLGILFHTGSFAQKIFSNWPNQFVYGFEKVANIHFLLLKPIKGKWRFILEIIKKIARWHHKSNISKRTVKTMIFLLLLRLWGCLGWQNNQHDPLLSPFCGFGPKLNQLKKYPKKQ